MYISSNRLEFTIYRSFLIKSEQNSFYNSIMNNDNNNNNHTVQRQFRKF